MTPPLELVSAVASMLTEPYREAFVRGFFRGYLGELEKLQRRPRRRRRRRTVTARGRQAVRALATPTATALSAPPPRESVPSSTRSSSSSSSSRPSAPTPTSSSEEPDVSRWRKTCGAVSHNSGRRCRLLEGHEEQHAAGREQFHLLAAPGATRFREADELARWALARPDGGPEW